jgi:hypothetical protein
MWDELWLASSWRRHWSNLGIRRILPTSTRVTLPLEGMCLLMVDTDDHRQRTSDLLAETAPKAVRRGETDAPGEWERLELFSNQAGLLRKKMNSNDEGPLPKAAPIRTSHQHNYEARDSAISLTHGSPSPQDPSHGAQEALAAYNVGLCVVPPREDGSKAPIVSGKNTNSTVPYVARFRSGMVPALV